MNPAEEKTLMHYGMPRRSGRYPWGSGEDPYQHGRDFLARYEELKKSGMTEREIAKAVGCVNEKGEPSTFKLRIEKDIATNERRALKVARAKSLREDGLGYTEIGRQMGISESTVRSLLDPKSEDRMNRARQTADILKKNVDEKGMIDVGRGVELELGVSKEKLNTALYLLEREGYPTHSGRFEQVTNKGQHTTQKVLCPPGTPHKDIYNLDKVHTIEDYHSRDGGETFSKFVYPASLDSKRMKIRYNEEGGVDKDGIVEIRRGVKDLSLGNDHYSQVRILVDGTHYIKGMAVYSDDIPDGVDIVFNTNKTKGTPTNKVLKEIKKDPDNPFGSLIKPGGQSEYVGDDGKKHLSLINKTRGEGDWTEWQDALPSQFLGKQSKAMAKKQLDLAKADKLDEFEAIRELNNPTIKKHLLEKFADGCDSAAVNLKAAALPGQKYHVIIPINTLKDTEVYAPGYETGTKLALVRYPHGGIFEIPILTVNNNHPPAKKLIGNKSIDAVGINKKVADRLSGADFDGDTVMCIPTHDAGGKVKIASKPGLKGLEGFDPKEKYGPHTYEGKNIKLMTKRGTQMEMGVISNLITDMTLAGASDEKLAAAVRHSMVVIDAEKHKLDYRQSAIDNNIAALHKEYQGKSTGGASTILSRAKGQATVDKRQGTPKINQKGKEWYDPSKPEGAKIYKTADDLYYPDRKYDKSTGVYTLRTSDGKKITYPASDAKARARYEPVKKVNKETGEVTYTNKDGDITYKLKKRSQKSTKMAETDDAYTLVSESRHQMELIYADYANTMKALANTARKEMVTTGKIAYDKNAAKVYAEEVSSLNIKLNNALMNTTRERAAQRKANAEISAKKKANPDMEAADMKKAGQQALTKYRSEVGSIARRDRSIKITDREWEAIQAGAISESKLKRILDNTDIEELRQRATPRQTTTLSSAKVARIKQLGNSNYTLEQIAAKTGVPKSTVAKYLKE